MSRILIPIFALSCVFLQFPEITQAAEFPLAISADGRKIVDQSGEPFFINGDTPWSLIGQVSKEDAELYIRDSANRGINSLIVTLVEGHYADNAPANYYGDQPFTTPGRFTTPNEAYFQHADWVIQKAAEFGILVIVAPNYLGCCNDGWLNDLRDNNTEADARWYGEWIGDRYKSFPNVMYVWGNDMNPGSLRAKIRTMALGVKSRDPNHLQTFHAGPENSALDQWSTSETWLDVNTTYTYEAVQVRTLMDYNRVPFLPFFLFETQYENDFLNATADQTRKQAYTAVLSGANGHHYGNYPIWHMNGAPSSPGDNWKNHLNDPGRASVEYIGKLFLSREWYKLVPDQAHNVVTGGIGSDQDYVAAALTSDGSTAIAYLPRQRSITLNLSQISGSSKVGWWFNPRNGVASVIDMTGLSGSQSFLPPASGDWVLVIDDQSANRPAPGVVVQQIRPLPPSDLRVQ